MIQRISLSSNSIKRTLFQWFLWAGVASARNVIRSYHRLLANGKLKRHRFHDLRHSCATFLLAKNIPARTVMEILGHSNISLTMNTYSHVMPEMLRDAADAMNAVILQSNLA